MALRFTKPILFIDTETTGKEPSEDRIVSIAIYPVVPAGYPGIKEFSSLVNPLRPIPSEATEIHKITDEMVKDAPTFRALVPTLIPLLCADHDIAGYNAVNFDFPLISAELERCGLKNVFPNKASRIIDPHRIFYNREPRTLAAAVKKYCGRSPVDSHECMVDAKEAFQVLLGQLLAYDDLKDATVDDLVRASKGEGELDIQGKLRRNKSGEVVFNFGKHLGARVVDKPDYVQWMLDKDFLPDTKEALRQEMAVSQKLRQGAWTPDEEKMLTQNFAVGLSTADLASKLKRSPTDVTAKLTALKLL